MRRTGQKTRTTWTCRSLVSRAIGHLGSSSPTDSSLSITDRLKEIHRAAAKAQARQRARAAAASSSHRHHDDDDRTDSEEDDDGHLSSNRPIDFFSSTSRFRNTFANASRPPIPAGATGNSVSFATVSEQIDAVMSDRTRQTRNGGARPYYAGGGGGSRKESTGRSRQTSVKRSFFATGSQSPLIAGGW
jgi:hypothetical protein